MAGRKRKSAPAAEDAPSTPEAPASRRRSQRVSSSAQKSKYFETESDSDSGRKESASKKGRGTGRPAKKAKVKEPETESDEEGDDYKEEADEVEQPADDSDEDIDEDAPPKVTFIPLPKLRDTGGIEYADDRLHPNTLAFLKDLKANNKRTWLKCKPPNLISANCNGLTCIISPRPRVPPRPQRLGVVRDNPHRQDHRGGPDDSRAALQGRQLSYLP